jgi:hypothetical protein
MTQMLIARPDVQVTAELLERCDRCGATAKAHVEVTAGGDLAFCGHHANRYSDRILAIASRVTLADGFAWRGADA